MILLMLIFVGLTIHTVRYLYGNDKAHLRARRTSRACVQPAPRPDSIILTKAYVDLRIAELEAQFRPLGDPPRAPRRTPKDGR
jgi:hypothetical protein